MSNIYARNLGDERKQMAEDGGQWVRGQRNIFFDTDFTD